ncbi:hypothetical protein EWM64_g5700 [Hericium alpestre]|uniref:MYND-type domain-containing protein n=1 Tax=Hericium alpestre TaxID=135208 RepID=A0A4Y9ZXZ0_9AGAM|nr:hypothetical protein EWM64_g5700 [Hericium alpestre]
MAIISRLQRSRDSAYTMSSVLANVCSQCREPGGPDKPLKACASCKAVYYCGKECQKKQWKAHKPFCREWTGTDFHIKATEAILRLRKAFEDTDAVPVDPWVRADDPKEIILTSLPARFWDESLNDPDGVVECAIPAWMKEPICRQPGFPHPVPSSASPAHELVDIPGSGIGMRATRPITAGDIIYAERPLAILPVKWISTNVPPNGEFATYEEWYQYAMIEREELLKVVLARMAPENQAAYRALANSHKCDGSSPLSGVLCTNSYALGMDPWFDIVPDIAERDEYQTTLCGVCEELSRINHSCGPNAKVSFHMPSFSFVLTAVRDIPVGGEITVSYCKLTVPTSERQKYLAPYGFTCTCKACSSPNISDTRRATIAASRQDPEDAIRAWLSNKKLAKDHLIKDSLQMMQLLEDEGLEVNWRYKGHAAVLAMVCAATGQRKNYLQARKKVMALSMACVPGKGCWLMELLPEVPEHQEFWMKRLHARMLL